MSTTTRDRQGARGRHPSSTAPAQRPAPARSAAAPRRTVRARRARMGRRVREVPRAVWALAIPMAGLTLGGLVMVLSATSVPPSGTDQSPWYYFARHVTWLAVGLVALAVAYRVPYRFWIRIAPVILGVAVLGLVAVLLPTPYSIAVNGSRRWLGANGWTAQPSELAKLGLVLWLAGRLGRPVSEVRDWRRSIRPAICVLFVLAVLVLAEPDLGTVVLLAILTFVMLAVAGARLDVLAALAVPGLLVVGMFSMVGYRRSRMLAFLDPWSHADGPGYQTLQSQVGLANGGVFGVGLGNSRVKWGFLPEAHTDFIFSIIGEEFGLVGCLVVLAAFMCLLVVGIRVSLRCADRVLMLIGVGVSSWIGLQALVNMGVTTGALPNKGLTLPFVSYGGSSLVVTLFAAGLLLQVARRSQDPATAVNLAWGERRSGEDRRRRPRPGSTDRRQARPDVAPRRRTWR